MGLMSPKQKLLTAQEMDIHFKNNNNKLEDLFDQVKRNEGFLTLEFFQIITLIEPPIASELYEIFSSNHKIYLPELKYFYTLFTSLLDKHKVFLISILLFKAQDEVKEDEYRSNAEKFLIGVPFFGNLIEPKFIKAITYSRMVNRNYFVNTFPIQLVSSFTFVKQIKGSHLEPQQHPQQKYPIDNNIFYCCECLIDSNGAKDKDKDKERDKDKGPNKELYNQYEEMKGTFMQIERMNRDIFPISEFENMMRDINLNPLLIKAIGIYLRKKTMNSFIYFDTFRDFMIRFTLKEDERINLLFEIFSFPNKEITMSSYIKEFFPNNTYTKASISKDDFTSLYQEVEVFKVMMGSMNKVNSIPYLYFGLTPRESKHKKLSLEVLMKGLSFHEFILENILNETEFICIDGQFVKSLQEYFNNPEQSPCADIAMPGIGIGSDNTNEPVLRLDTLYDENRNFKRNLVYQEDFYLCTSKIFRVLSNWFRRRSNPHVLKKIVYDEDKGKTTSTPTTKSQISDSDNSECSSRSIIRQGNPLIKIVDGKVHEIDLHPIYVIFCSLENVYSNLEEHTMDQLYQFLDEILSEKYNDNTKSAEYSRKMKLCDITKHIKLGRDVVFNMWLYYNKKLFMPKLSNTFEEEKVADSCLMVLDPLKGSKCYYDLFIQEKDKDTGAKDNEKKEESNANKEVTADVKSNLDKGKEDTTIAQSETNKEGAQEAKEVNESKTDGLNENESKANKEVDLTDNKSSNTTTTTTTSTTKEIKDEQIPLQSSKANQSSSSTIKEQPKEEHPHCSPLGIINIGNSCYLNSVTQIIINMPHLRDILLMPYIPVLINRSNKNSNNGLLISEIISLIKHRWTLDVEKEIKLINPQRLKLISGKIHPQFRNNDQQDANEYMTFVLDECNEEINIKSTKTYYPNPDQGNNTIEELSNIYWANAMRRSTSFINALFLFQLQNRLICSGCQYEKISFDTCNHLFLPIPLSKTINLKITINRLPFEYKTYYHKINEGFRKYLSENAASNMTLSKLLSQYHLHQMICDDESGNGNGKDVDVDEEMNNTMSIPIQFEMDVQRAWTIEDMLQKIRAIEYLKLEPLEHVIKEENGDYSIELINNDTYLLICLSGSTPSNKFYHHKLKIDSCFQDSQSIVIYELLNHNGLNKLKSTTESILSMTKPKPETITNTSTLIKPLLFNTIKCDIAQFEKVFLNEKSFENTISSVDTLIAVTSIVNNLPAKPLPTPTPIPGSLMTKIESYNKTKTNRYTEYVLQIQHCTQKHQELYLFNKIGLLLLKFPDDYLIVNNSNENITPRELYNYIWTKYKRYFKDPNAIQSKLWWESTESSCKICYPFQLKWSKRYLNYRNAFICTQCSYYHFCNGCIIDPSNTSPLFFEPNSIILVNWCSLINEQELMSHLFSYSIVKRDLSPKIEETDKDKTLSDCLELYLEKETLDDKIKCDKCKAFQYFNKSFLIDKVPHVLVLSLNRFKYVAMYNKKITTMIRFPLKDLSVKDEVYDLYGVVYHFGAMNFGHYTAVVKIEDKWIYFDDSRYQEVREGNVVTSDAYILVYISRRDIGQCDYYRMMMSMVNQLKNDKEVSSFKKYYEPEWSFGQPVNTPKGEGYYIKEGDDEGEEEIVVHLNKEGRQAFKKKEVTKQTQLIPSKLLDAEELKEIEENVQQQQLQGQNNTQALAQGQTQNYYTKGKRNVKSKVQQLYQQSDCILF